MLQFHYLQTLYHRTQILKQNSVCMRIYFRIFPILEILLGDQLLYTRELLSLTFVKNNFLQIAWIVYCQCS